MHEMEKNNRKQSYSFKSKRLKITFQEFFNFLSLTLKLNYSFHANSLLENPSFIFLPNNKLLKS